MRLPLNHIAVRSAILSLFFVSLASAQYDVLTQHNDNARSGANLNETQLTPPTLKDGKFGKLCYRVLDENAYAQPLYASGVEIAGKGLHNVVFVVTEGNSAYAFDADDTDQASTSALLWGPVKLGEPVPTEILSEELTGRKNSCADMTPVIGTTGTPAITPDKKHVFLVAKTFRDDNGVHHYANTLHVLNLSDGKPACPPIVVEGEVAGTGNGSVDGKIKFNSKLQFNRPGLLLVKNVLYVAFGGHCDRDNYHGWLFAYDVADASKTRMIDVFCTTPNTVGPTQGAGSIWQSGQGPAADDEGNVYFATGNGGYNETSDYGDSVLKVSLVEGKLKLVDWFTPSNHEKLNEYDADLGSAGPAMLPGGHQFTMAGKEGKAYLLDRNDLGKGKKRELDSFPASPGPVTRPAGGNPIFWNIHGSFIAWEQQSPVRECFLYMCAEEDRVKQYKLVPDGEGKWKFESHLPVTQSKEAAAYPNYPVGRFNDPTRREPIYMPGGFLSLSANKDKDGIIWASMPLAGNANRQIVRGILRAYDARDLSTEIWDSEMTASDSVGMFAKFVAPTVANGKVYLTSFQEELPGGEFHRKKPDGLKPALAIYGIQR